jgi:hypothetical protein
MIIRLTSTVTHYICESTIFLYDTGFHPKTSERKTGRVDDVQKSENQICVCQVTPSHLHELSFSHTHCDTLTHTHKQDTHRCHDIQRYWSKIVCLSETLSTDGHVFPSFFFFNFKNLNLRGERWTGRQG